jgi:hypothetical protein
MPPRRTPALIALEILDCVDANKEATKWDLIKVLGNEAQFGVWVERFFLVDGILVERREGRNYFYGKTERGELLHKLLRSGFMIRVFSRVSGKKLRD